MNWFFKMACICACIGVVALSSMAIIATVSMIDRADSEIEIITEIILDVDTDKIVTSNGDVIFVQGISRYEWQIRKTYEITIETCSDRFGYENRRLREVKEV